MGGLLPSSSRRQSRDLRDFVPGHAASADHKGTNGSHRQSRGSDRRTRGQQDNHGAVRLVRMRTRSNFDQDACWGAEFLVLQGENGRDLEDLLKDTQPVCRWQQGLRRLLATYIRPQDTRQALDFLQRNMETAIVAVEHPSQSPGYPALFIDVKHKPDVLNLDHWKEIVLALHFEITEPESNRQLDLLEVKVTKQVTLGSLLGLKFLLRSIANLSPDMLRMVLTLTSDEARGLLALMQSTTDDSSPSQAEVTTVHSLYVRYPDQLSALGFSLARRGKSTQWSPQDASASPRDLQVVLVGLFHAGLETYI